VDPEKLKLQGGVPPNATQAIMQAVNNEISPSQSAASNVAKLNKEVYKDPKKSKKQVKLM
jgi:hypothetical protein